MLVAQSCLTLCDPKNCGPPGRSVHGILQARILKTRCIPFLWKDRGSESGEKGRKREYWREKKSGD